MYRLHLFRKSHISTDIVAEVGSSARRQQMLADSWRKQLANEQLLSRHSTESLPNFKEPLHATAPANAIKATLDMSSKYSATLPDVPPNVTTNTTVVEAIPLMRGKLSARELARRHSVGLPLVVDIPSEDLFASEGQTMGQSRSLASSQHSVDDNRGQSHVQQKFEQRSSVAQGGQSAAEMFPFTSVYHATCVPVALDMSPKTSKTSQEHVAKSSEIEAVSLVMKPTGRAVARKDSVGVPLVVESIPHEQLREKHPEALTTEQPQQATDGTKAQGHVLHQPLCSYTFAGDAYVNGSKMISQPIFQSSTGISAPANSVKGTLDMSTKVSKQDMVPNFSDPMSLVRTRPSASARARRDSVGVPLIVEQPSSEEQPISQQAQATTQDQRQHTSDRCVSIALSFPLYNQTYQTVSAPTNSIKGLLDMSPKRQQKSAEQPPDPNSAVPLIRDRQSLPRNSSVGISLVVEPTQSKPQMLERTLSLQPTQDIRAEEPNPCAVKTNKTLHQHLNRLHTNDGPQPQNKPMDFSTPEIPKATRVIHQSYTDLADGRPVDFAIKAKQEIDDGRHRVNSSIKKTCPDIVDLTVNVPDRRCVIKIEEAAEDFSTLKLYHLEQTSTPPATHYVVREDALLSSCPKPQSVEEVSIVQQFSEQSGIRSRGKSVTLPNFNVSSPSTAASAPASRPIHMARESPMPFTQDIHGRISVVTPENTYQELNASHVIESQKFQHQPFPAQPWVPQSPQQQASVGVNLVPDKCGAQPTLPVLQQRTPDQHALPLRPILIKQPTVDSMGSIDDSTFDVGTMTSRKHLLSTSTTQPEYERHQIVLNAQFECAQPLLYSSTQLGHGNSEVSHPPQSWNVQQKRIPPVANRKPDHVPIQYGSSQCPGIVEQQNVFLNTDGTAQTVFSEKSGITTQPLALLQQNVDKQNTDMLSSQSSTGPHSVQRLESKFSGLAADASFVTKPAVVAPPAISKSTDNCCLQNPSNRPSEGHIFLDIICGFFCY